MHGQPSSIVRPRTIYRRITRVAARFRNQTDVCLDVLAPDASSVAENPYLRLLQPHVDHGRCVVHHLSVPAISLEQQWAIPRFVRKLGHDLYFYPHFDVPSFVPIPLLFVVHDLIPSKVPGYVLRFEALKKKYYKSCVRCGLRNRFAFKCASICRMIRKLKTTKQNLSINCFLLSLFRFS